MSHLVEIKKREREKGGGARREVWRYVGFFVTTRRSRREEFRRKPPGQCGRRMITAVHLLRAVVTMYLAKAKSFHHHRRYCLKSRKLRERPVPFFSFSNKCDSESTRRVQREIFILDDSTTPSPCDSRSFSRSALSHFIGGDEKGHDNPDRIPSACANHFPRKCRVENLPCDEIRNFKG